MSQQESDDGEMPQSVFSVGPCDVQNINLSTGKKNFKKKRKKTEIVKIRDHVDMGLVGSCGVHNINPSPEILLQIVKINALSKPHIHKVGDLLRKVNEKAYEPVMLAIGPYHHGKPHLEMMEAHKLQYLELLLQRRNKSSLFTYSVDTYVTKLRQLENEIQIFYGKSTGLDENELLRMIVIDGCFIIEFLRKFGKKDQVYDDDANDPIFQKNWMLSFLKRDLLLFENQLPFSVLNKLFEDELDIPSKKGKKDELDIVDMALNFLGCKLPNPCCRNEMSSDKVDHLLGLIHHSWNRFHGCPNDECRKDEDPFIRCTIKLQRFGILFKKATESHCLFDIKFEEGVMKIPSLKVDDEVEWLFRNLIAYEQYHQSLPQRYVTDYAIFMDRLVDTAKDVEQLCDHGIIENRLGNDELVSDMFNKLCCNVAVNPRSFCYSQDFKNVNDYSAACHRRACGEISYHLRNLNIQFSIMTLILAVIQIVIPFYTNS